MEGYCERCNATVETEYERPSQRRWAHGYLLIIIPLIPLFPFIASDYVVCIPLTMIYMMGLGPVLGIIKQRPTCCECGAYIPRPVKGLAKTVA